MTEQMTTTRDAHELKAALKRDANVFDDEPIAKGYKGAITGTLNKQIGEQNRHLFLAWLFDYEDGDEIAPKSSKTLTEGEWWALARWVEFWQETDSDAWHVAGRFPVEAALVLTQAIKAYEDSHVLVEDPLFDPPAVVAEAVKLGGEITNSDVKDKPSPVKEPSPQKESLLSGTKFARTQGKGE